MLRCREVSKLVSESLDRRIPLRTRLQVWLHLAMCRLCWGFARQLRLLRRAAHDHPERLLPDGFDRASKLSPQARERIQAALEQQSD